MISVFPKFYQAFHCKADKCQHSCCRGWEIDIDAETAQKYLAMEGELGAEIRRNIGENEEGHFFKLNNDERCPFLQENGLCKIILNTGEENICEICTMHPRFFTLIEDVELCGVGLSCEKTCELLLAENKELVFYIEDTGEELNFAELLEIMALDLPKKRQDFSLEINEENISRILEIMSRTEPIDEEWTQRIAWLQEQENIAKAVEEYLQGQDKTVIKNIYQYILYRQIERITDTALEKIIAYAQYSMLFILLEAAMGKALGESVRRWSEQIEYDMENVDYIFKNI